MASNDIAGIEAVADRVGILRGGRLVVDEELEGLKARFHRLSAAVEPVLDEAARGAEVVASRRVAGGVQAVVRSPRAADPEQLGGPSIEVHPMSLEEIFVALCGEPDGREP